MVPTHFRSRTRLSVILDAVPDMDSKPNFPQVASVPDYIICLIMTAHNDTATATAIFETRRSKFLCPLVATPRGVLIGSQIRLQTGEYENPQEFDREMHELFLKARRYHEAGSDAYGSVLVLQVTRTSHTLVPT